MSEVAEKPAEIVPAKSEDKLEIEKEELEKVEDKVEEATTEVKEEDKKEDKNESQEQGESSKAEKGEMDGDDTEKKEIEKPDEKEKKFTMPKIKTPKIIKEIRSRSKSREKKKKKDKDEDDNEEVQEKDADEEKKEQKAEEEGEKEEKTEKEEETDEKAKESEEKEKLVESDVKTEDSEKKDVVKEAKSKVKDALDSIHLPKMPKMHKPAFLKKKNKEEEEEKVQNEEEKKDDTAEDTKDEKETNVESNEKTEKMDEKEEHDDGKDEKKPEEKVEDIKEKNDVDENEKKEDSEKSEEGVEERKPTILDSFKNIKAPKMPNIFSKSKKGENDLESGKCDESEQLLEEKDQPEGDEKEEGEAEPKEKQKGTSILKSIRSVASGVPGLFKKDSPKEIDVESGEKEDLLEKKEDTTDSKPDDLKMEEIKLDEDDKKEDIDNKSEGSEKKDPEKDGEVIEEKSKMDRFKRLPSDAARQVSSLDKQKLYGLVGILIGLLLITLVIVIAALTPKGWQNYHKLVEGGKYVETETSCGKVWGWVEGEDRFLFRAIPYSVEVERFSQSRLPVTLDECGDELKHPANESRFCTRRTTVGVVGEEDCLTLDIATSSVIYDNPAPVVAYISGDNTKLVPSADLAHKHGVVFVTISIRQGVLGYLSHGLLSESEKPPTSGNYALGDLITALEWIRLNIRHFGGDPDRVTLLGHQQGASVVTALSALEEGQGLYKRIWASGGAGNIDSLSLEDANKQFNDLVEAACKEKDWERDCLIELYPAELLAKLEEDSELWSHDNLPSRGESTMLSWITTDTKLVRSSLSKLWSSSPISVPIVFGTAAQAEANPVNYQLYDWNNTDQVDSIVEGSLGSFDVSLASGALELYNSSNNWLDYISMVSDIRTVCPLRQLASDFKQNFSSSAVSFYIAQQPSPSEEDESGNVADSSTDISAIFGLYKDQTFGENLQRKFFQFVKGDIDKLSADVTIFDKEEVKDNDERCSFWTTTSEEIVPKFGKRF